MKLLKKITWQHSRWNEVILNDNDHMRKAGYDLVLRRSPSMSYMKSHGGQMVCGIDAKSVEIIKKYPRMERSINMLKIDFKSDREF